MPGGGVSATIAAVPTRRMETRMQERQSAERGEPIVDVFDPRFRGNVQAAVDWAARTHDRATIRVPFRDRGVIQLDATVLVPAGISLDCDPGVWFDCAGRGFDGFRFVNWSHAAARHLCVRNVGAGREEYNGILVMGDCRDFTLEYCEGSRCGDAGIAVKRDARNGARPADGTLRRCRGTATTDGSGIEIYRADRITLIEPVTESNSMHGLRTLGGRGLRVVAPRSGNNRNRNFYIGGAADVPGRIVETIGDWEMVAPRSYSTGDSTIVGIALNDGTRHGILAGGEIEGGGVTRVGVYVYNDERATGPGAGVRDAHVRDITTRGVQYGIRAQGTSCSVTFDHPRLFLGGHPGGDNIGVYADDLGREMRDLVVEDAHMFATAGISRCRAFYLRDAHPDSRQVRRGTRKILHGPSARYLPDVRRQGAGTLLETGTELIRY